MGKRHKLCFLLPSCRSSSKIVRQEIMTKRHIFIQLMLFCVSFPVTSPSLTHGDWNAFLLQNQTKCWNFYLLQITRKFTNICVGKKMLEVYEFPSELQKALVCQTQKPQNFLTSLYGYCNDQRQHKHKHDLWENDRHSKYLARKPLGFTVVECKMQIWLRFGMGCVFKFKKYIQKQFNINVTFLTFNLFYNCYSDGPGEAVLLPNVTQSVTQNVTMITFCRKRPPWTIFLPSNDLEIVFQKNQVFFYLWLSNCRKPIDNNSV